MHALQHADRAAPLPGTAFRTCPERTLALLLPAPQRCSPSDTRVALSGAQHGDARPGASAHLGARSPAVLSATRAAPATALSMEGSAQRCASSCERGSGPVAAPPSQCTCGRAHTGWSCTPPIGAGSRCTCAAGSRRAALVHEARPLNARWLPVWICCAAYKL